MCPPYSGTESFYVRSRDHLIGSDLINVSAVSANSCCCAHLSLVSRVTLWA